MGHTVNYTPSPTVQQFIKSPAFIRAIMGPFGSGKSVGCVMTLMKMAMDQPVDDTGKRRTRFVIIRNTAPQLRDTTIKTVHEWVPPGIAGRWMKSERSFHLRFGDVESEWMFRALDDPDDVANLLGIEVTSAWVNEYREIDAQVFAGLLGRLGRFPARKFVPPWYGVLMDSNPPDEGDFWYNFFEEDLPPEMLQYKAMMESVGRPLIEHFKQPGGLSPEAENIENLPPHYYQTMLIGGHNEDYIRKHVHGEYGRSREGQPVYPNFVYDFHVAKSPLIANPHEPLAIGMDFGLTPAAVFYQQVRGKWLVYDELVTKDPMGLEQFVERRLLPHLARVFPDCKEYLSWNDPAGTQRSQADETTCFQILKQYGFHPRGGPQDLTTRIGSITRALTRQIDGGPGLLIDPRCKTIVNGMRGKYRFRRKKTDAQDWAPVPDKNFESHIMNALEYGIGAYEGPALKSAANKPRPWQANRQWLGPIQAQQGGVWGD